jgi:hypothetical protein
MRYYEYLDSSLWEENKQRCRDRYGNRCSIKGCKAYAQDYHHLRYDFIGTKEDFNYIKPLCRNHHRKAHYRLGFIKVPLTPKELMKRYKELSGASWRPSTLFNWLIRL